MVRLKNTPQTFPGTDSQQSMGESILLHITPGIITTAALLGIKPLIDHMGYPPLLAFLAAVIFVDIPLMLGLMLLEGKKINGRFSFQGVVLYRNKTDWNTFILVFIGGFILLYLVITITAPINAAFMEKAFSWMPAWLFFEELSQYDGFSKNVLILVFTLQLAVTGILLPLVEEYYFRGYLLPRISRFSGWAPLLGGALFGFYHTWQLNGWVGVSLLGIGLGYIVWWKKISDWALACINSPTQFCE